jgi:DNA-binding beta-propeller fold protein YncE
MDYVDGVSVAVIGHPYTLHFDPADESLFVASFTLNHVVRMRMDPEKKKAKYKVFVSGRELDGPVGMALHTRNMYPLTPGPKVLQRSLYVASFTNDKVLQVDAQSGELLGTLGNDEELDCPEGIAIHNDHLYVTSFLLQHVVRYDLRTGECLGQFAPPAAGAAAPQPLYIGPGETGFQSRSAAPPRRPPKLLGAEDIAFDWNGDLHVSAYHSNAVHKFNGTTGAFEAEYGKGLLRGPVGVAVGPDDGDVYVSSYRANQVLRFTPAGGFVGIAAGAEQQVQGKRQLISSPSGLAFDPHDGTLHVLSYVSGSITRFNASAAGGRAFWRITQ